MKTCIKCSQIKDFNDFYKSKSYKDGFSGTCKTCRSLISKEWRNNNGERKKELDRKYRLENKGKVNSYKKEWAKNNPNKVAKSRKKWRENNPEKCEGYWKKHNSRRDKSVRERKCAWADREKIKKVYRECRMISRSTGIKHHVDHIIPLKRKDVCGLHHESNLRIIPAKDNLKKSNKVL